MKNSFEVRFKIAVFSILVNRALDSKFQILDIHPKLEAKETVEFATIKAWVCGSLISLLSTGHQYMLNNHSAPIGSIKIPYLSYNIISILQIEYRDRDCALLKMKLHKV